MALNGTGKPHFSGMAHTCLSLLGGAAHFCRRVFDLRPVLRYGASRDDHTLARQLAGQGDIGERVLRVLFVDHLPDECANRYGRTCTAGPRSELPREKMLELEDAARRGQ